MTSRTKKPQAERVTIDANGFVLDIEPVEMPDKRRKAVKAAKKAGSRACE